MVCKVADFVFEFNGINSATEVILKPFECFENPQATFSVTHEEILKEQEIATVESSYTNSILAVLLRKIAEWIIPKNAFLMHTALIDVDGVGVGFAAASGTGKTTHLLLWKKLLEDRMTVINGDKPIVRFFEDSVYPIGYGTAWNGKERMGNAGNTPICHICFIERAENNSCTELTAAESISLLFKQVYISSNADSVTQTLKLMDTFLKNVRLWKIKCNMDVSAAQIAYDTIFKEKQNEA